MKYRVLFFFMLLSASGFSQVHQTLSLEQSSVLKKFFQVLTEDSEAGYVFYDMKPVCIHGYFCTDPFAVNSVAHKQAVALREGACVWKQLVDKHSDIIVHVCDREDPNIPGYIHVLVINVPLFHKVVKENLSLFQYVLGPAVTSENLLEALIANNQTFHSLFKDDKVLVGEVLGFGIQNSLYVSRIEDIQEAFEKETPPFIANALLVKEYEQEYLPLKPSFGFASVKEELNALEEKVKVSSEKLIQRNPEFIFGWLKDSKESKLFISELESTQDKIQKVLASPKFLKTVLEKVTEKKYVLNERQSCQFHFEKNQLNKTVAKGLWEAIQDYDYEYLPYFIEGLETSESEHVKTDRIAWFPSYRREFLEGKENLQKSDELFQLLDNDKNFQCVVAKKLYFKTLKEGRGNTECRGPCVTLSYSIFSPLGHCLANNDSACLNLKNTIPGFAYGVRGMKIGETREIYIHPSLAYGFDTSLGKCVHFRVIATLLDIHDNNGCTPALECFDLSFLMKPENMIVRNENYKMALMEKGREIAKHLKKCKEIDLSLISNYLKQFHDDKEITYSTTQDEQDIINRVHWNIYYAENPS